MLRRFLNLCAQASPSWSSLSASRRTALLGLTGVTALAGFSSCTDPVEEDSDPASSHLAKPKPQLEFTPADGSSEVNPGTSCRVHAKTGKLLQVQVMSDDGQLIAGKMSSDSVSFETTALLEFGHRYLLTGLAIAEGGDPEPFFSTLSTLYAKEVAEVNVNIGDGQPVGVAAPIILRFSTPIINKSEVQKSLSVVCDPPVEGSWAWLPDAVGEQIHWRAKNYFPSGTKVHVKVPLFAVDFGNEIYCGTPNLTSDFTISRHQLVKCYVPSHRMQVFRNDALIMDFPCSYGEGNQARNTTRTGIHVVTEKYEDFYMSNPPYYYNAHERFAVRISNNGEFIHANPQTVGDQGNTNVSNGCVNLSPDHAQQYFQSALYGDPVEVTGTSVALSPSDGEIYDWTYDWNTWMSLSAPS